MPDYVRVKHAETGHHYTVSRAKAMTDPKLRIIDAPAVDINGRPLPPTYAKPRQRITADAKPAQKESK